MSTRSSGSSEQYPVTMSEGLKSSVLSNKSGLGFFIKQRKTFLKMYFDVHHSAKCNNRKRTKLEPRQMLKSAKIFQNFLATKGVSLNGPNEKNKRLK